MPGNLSHVFIWSVIIGGALSLAVVGYFDTAPKSPFVWLQFPLLFLLAWGAFTNGAESKDRVPLLPFVAISWLLGMTIELSLTVDGSGIGGIHPDTRTSFALAQGDYLPLALVTWIVQRWLGYRLNEMIWVVVGMGLTEGLVFTGSITSALQAGSVIGTVIVTCYLIAIYLVYLWLPFRICRLDRGQTTHSIVLLVIVGFASAMIVRVFWGLIYSPFVLRLL